MDASRTSNKLPLVVIVGPTASGKTSLAVKLAQSYGGEIISADSRTVYRGMDIGTAKPTQEERSQVPHWGLDLVNPDERFTAADFQGYAQQKIIEVRSRGHVPFLVGGTGLYIDAVVFDYQFEHNRDSALRQKFASWSLEELYEYCISNNIDLPENAKNKRYVIRAIEQKGINTTRKLKPGNDTVIVGIATDKNILRARIEKRTEQLFDDGVVKEATLLGERYGWQYESMTGNIYRLAKLYLEGELNLDQYKKRFTTLDWQLAKRQITWLRRNPFINWLSLEEAEDYLSLLLAKSR